MQKYGLKNPDGTANKSKKDHISGVIVSVLQAGAFFGALTSAPLSGTDSQFNRIIQALESSHRCMDSPFREEENPSSVLCYLLCRRCEYLMGISLISR